uniref:Flavin-containing monooxygenase n=1 Tax=Panagrolaimus sp. ES5 TaxID=591445 RepID=A0AC34GIV9_9BILA
FNHKVLSIDRSEDYSKTGKWKITYLNEKDEENVEIFDGVLLASGHHSEARWPSPFPGQDKFTGKLLHSHDYYTHKGFEDQVVAVVGIGNSGGDLAVELSRIAKQVYLVTRRGTWICNRLIKGGYPADAALVTRKGNFVRSLLPLNMVNDTMEKLLSQTLNHEAYGLKPAHRVLSAHPTCNDELANRLANKTVKIKPNIKEFTQNGI